MLVLVPMAAVVHAQPACCGLPEIGRAQDCATQDPRCWRFGDDTWLSVSGDYRARWETFDRLDYGIGDAPDYTALAHRARFAADWRQGRAWRLLVQVAAADENGREPAPRSFDQSEPDLAQAFIEAPLPLNATLRMGRQEWTLDRRVVALRDGVLLRRAFDGLRLDLPLDRHWPGAVLTGLHLSPVLNEDGAFDDRRTANETISGLSARLPTHAGAGYWNGFAFERRRKGVRYPSAAGDERRRTFGVRHHLSASRWQSSAQIAVQTGEVGRQRIRALDLSVGLTRQPQADETVQFGASLGLATGDRAADDGRLHRFDPLYPSPASLTDAPLSYFANQINAQLNAARVFGPLRVRASATLLARHRRNDAIYAASGRPLATPSNDGKLSAALFELSARWRAHPRLELYGSVLHAEALDGVQAAGGGDAGFAMLQMTTGF